MARKRHSDEDILKLLRELKLTAGDDVASACRSVGISDATYYNWRRRFGGMGRSQLSEMKSLEKESEPCRANGPSDIGECGGCREADLLALLASGQSEAESDVGLAGSGGPQSDHVLAPGDELTTGQFHHEHLVLGRDHLKVEAVHCPAGLCEA